MKTAITIIMATASLWALTGTIKYENVTVEIAGKKYDYKKGENFTFDYGQKICLLSKGDGVIKIIGEGQIDEDTPCETFEKKIRIPSSTLLSIVLNSNITKKVEEASVNGVGSRDSVDENAPIDIVVDKGFKELVIESSEWGHLPITLSVKNSKGEVVESFVNKESKKSLFRVMAKSVDINDTVVVTNKKNEVLLNVRLVDESNK